MGQQSRKMLSPGLGSDHHAFFVRPVGPDLVMGIGHAIGDGPADVVEKAVRDVDVLSHRDQE